MDHEDDLDQSKYVGEDSDVESVSLEQENKLLFDSSRDLLSAAEVPVITSSRSTLGDILPFVSAAGYDTVDTLSVQVSL